MSEDDNPKPMAREKLQLMKSPVVGSDYDSEDDNSAVLPADGQGLPNLSGMGDRIGPTQTTPEFQRHEDASILELFFDLFFAANYTIFSTTRPITSLQRLSIYIGYFCLLWMTWLSVGLYDVRFITDSIFERVARGVHLGVMVGFAVVAPHFDPTAQDKKTMRTMSLILMVSRLCLTVEYCSILWHVRKFKKARLPLYLQIAILFSAAMVYLGIAFRFRDKNSQVYIVWYIISALEALLTIAISNFWSVLRFTETHLMKRMSLLTIVILGDGVVIIAQKVVDIVGTSSSWNSLTIGLVTSATATVYFVFLIYFDWMKHDHLPPLRQQIWTAIHFPFHLALVLFMQGFTQFVTWSKVADVFNHLSFESVLDSMDGLAASSSQDVKDSLRKMTYDYFDKYPPTYQDTWDTADLALNNITGIPDSFWPQVADGGGDSEDLAVLTDTIYTLMSCISNGLFEAFKIDISKDVADEDPNSSSDGANWENEVQFRTWDRYMLIFSYGYAAAGLTLVVMTFLTIISRIHPWTPWPIIRIVINFLLAIGVGLVALLYYNSDRALNYLFSPWVLPTIALVWAIVLVLTHIHNPPPLFFRQSAMSARGAKQHEYGQVAVAVAEDANITRKPTEGDSGAV